MGGFEKREARNGSGSGSALFLGKEAKEKEGDGEVKSTAVRPAALHVSSCGCALSCGAK